MRQALAAALTRLWYQPRFSPILWLLWPLSLLFRAIVCLRRWAYQFSLFKQTRFSVPVIVVGNITVGGTGKTPMVVALAKFLQQQGYRPGIVSRGYGRASTDVIRVSDDDSADRVGDEALMLKRQTGVPVVVGPSRVSAVTALLQNDTIDVVLSDDGLQHLALARDIEIVVINGELGLGNGQSLPAGPLRERPARLQHADFCLIKGERSAFSGYAFQLMPQSFVQIGTQTALPLNALQGQTVHAIAGIGNPAQFFDLLASLGCQVIAHPFPDHYAFTEADIHFDDDCPVVMTSKDAVKCASWVGQRHLLLDVDAVCDPQFFIALEKRLAQDGPKREAQASK